MAAGGARRWAAAAVWALAALGVHGGRYYLACAIQCCTFLPSCQGATSMTCHCPNSDQILLRNGDIPPSVEYIELSGARSVWVGAQAVYELHELRDLSVRDVGSLEVRPDGLALSAGARLQTLRLERLRTVQLHEDALSGHWPAGAELSLQHIPALHLKRRALHFTADDAGPHVLLEHVAALHAKADAFRATVNQLSLVNVSMDVCQPGTFRGHVRSLSLLGCSLSSLETHCVQPDGHWDDISLQHCQLGEVRPRALTGDVGTLLLEGGNVTRLHGSAVQMTLSRLELSRVAVQEVESRALDVSVCESVVVVESRVEVLRRHALASVRLADCARHDVRPFTIHLLHVNLVEDGALAVHASVPADAVNWDSIMFDDACSCETLGGMARLVADDADRMTATERELVAVVRDRGFCSDAHGRPERLADAGVGCPDWPGSGDGAGGEAGDDAESSLDQNIVFYGVIGAAALLALVLVAVLIAKRRRVGRALGCAGAPEPAACDTLQSRQTVATSTLSSATGGSTLDSQPRRDRRMPDLLHASPGVDLSPPRASPPPQEHIYAEISPVPPVNDYADPRDSVALRHGGGGGGGGGGDGGGGGAAREASGLYAEVAPLVSGGRPPAALPPHAGDPRLQRRPPPLPDGVPLSDDDRDCPMTEL